MRKRWLWICWWENIVSVWICFHSGFLLSQQQVFGCGTANQETAIILNVYCFFFINNIFWYHTRSFLLVVRRFSHYRKFIRMPTILGSLSNYVMKCGQCAVVVVVGQKFWVDQRTSCTKEGSCPTSVFGWNLEVKQCAALREVDLVCVCIYYSSLHSVCCVKRDTGRRSNDDCVIWWLASHSDKDTWTS